jgi:hypothetical protein
MAAWYYLVTRMWCLWQKQVWQHEPFNMAEVNGLLYGRGTCDMKGFIACTMAMLPKFTGAGSGRSPATTNSFCLYLR